MSASLLAPTLVSASSAAQWAAQSAARWAALPIAQGTPQNSLWVGAAPYLLVFVIFYFVWWRPVQRRQKAAEAELAKMTKGDRVITNGGFYGKVVRVDDDVVLLEVADGVRVRVSRRAISGYEGDGPLVDAKASGSKTSGSKTPDAKAR